MRTLLPAVLVSLATGCGSATARLETTEAMPAAASSAAPPAEDAHGSPPAPRERFSWTAPIALEPVKGTSRVRRLSDQADWASTSPDSRHVITGRTYRDGGIADAELGRATLHPEGRKLPVTVVDDRGAVFSPDGRHVLVRSAGSAWRPRGGAAWQSARPRLTVLRVPSLAVVTEVDGADATWIGPRSIAFRRAAQAMRLDLDGDAPVPVGVSQRSFGCTAESFGPDTPCSSGRWSYLDAIDPSFTTWIVSDSCMLRLHTGAPPTAACHPHVAVRALDLSTGKSRTLAAAESVEDHIFADESPAASRVCFWLDRNGAASLFCARVAGGDTELVFEGGQRGMLAWLGEDRLLVERPEEEPVVVDLRAHTFTQVTGLPAGAEWPVALPGGRRVVFTRSSNWVVDLEAGTFAASPYCNGPHSLFPAPRTDDAFVVQSAQHGPISMVEL